MTTVADILDVPEALAPTGMKMDWDNVGLLCGSRKKEVEQVLVALDPFEDVCDEAVEWGADVIVTHHPLIFRPVANVTDETSVGRIIERLCSAGICAVNAHTNLDCAPGGVNDELAAVLGLRSVTVLNPSGTDAQGRPWGLLRGHRRHCHCRSCHPGRRGSQPFFFSKYRPLFRLGPPLFSAPGL